MATNIGPVEFYLPFCDDTDEFNPAQMSNSPFRDNVETMLEDIKWRIERESSAPPRHGPIQSIGGHTVEPKFKILNNGAYERMELIPQADYLTTDFSVEAQYDRLLDISDRFIAAALEGRTDELTRIVWRASNPAIKLYRYIRPTGLLLVLTGSVAWV